MSDSSVIMPLHTNPITVWQRLVLWDVCNNALLTNDKKAIVMLWAENASESFDQWNEVSVYVR